MFFIYDILYFIVLTLMLPLEYMKRPAGLRARWLRERFGYYEKMTVSSGTIWVHAVSVGEVITAVPLIRRLKERHPSLGVILSTVTDTGQKVAMEQACDIATVIYVPFDLPASLIRMLLHFKPSLLIIMETELWPNIIRTAKANGLRVLLMNGRISEKSFKGYKKLKFFFESILKKIDFFCMQVEAYAERIIELGADPLRVAVIGSFKFDTRPSSPVPAWTNILGRPVIIAGSTHRTEEELIIGVYDRLKNAFPALNLIVAPRHPERFDEVEGLLKSRNAPYLRASQLEGRENLGKTEGVVVLMDVMGCLSSVYGAADIAVMGGTFIEHGGQNPLEPAYWGKAIVCGPHMENFPFIGEFYKNRGAVEVSSETLYETLKGLLEDPGGISLMGLTAKSLYEKNAGAVERAVEVVGRYLK